MKIKNFWSSYWLGTKKERENYTNKVCAEKNKEYEMLINENAESFASPYLYEHRKKMDKKMGKAIEASAKIKDNFDCYKKIHRCKESIVWAFEILGVAGCQLAAFVNPAFLIPEYFLVGDVLARARCLGDTAPKEYKGLFALPPEGTGLIGIFRDAYKNHSTKKTAKRVVSC